MSQPAISITNFSKSFGAQPVVRDLNFEVGDGEVFAFLGANGSGKTTTIRCLLGIYAPDNGELLIHGEKYDQTMSGGLGYLPEERGLYTTSRVLETIIYFGQIKGMTYAAAKQAAEAYLERVDLADKANNDIKSLSSGQQQKIQLGITIINRPRLLILDEPTKGLDPVNRALLLDILMELNKTGTTIMFSTHQMDEAERIANRLVMIKHGDRALYGEVNEVKRSFGSNVITAEFSGKLEPNSTLFTGEINQHSAKLIPQTGISPEEVLQYLIKQPQLKLSQFSLSTPSLNDIFIKVTNSPDA